jgi:hypothetical protein
MTFQNIYVGSFIMCCCQMFFCRACILARCFDMRFFAPLYDT